MTTERRAAPTAVIIREGRLLLARRPEGKSFAGLWETPGGKDEPGETAEGALKRELREELGVDACIGEQIASVRLDPPVTSRSYDIPIYIVHIAEHDEPRPLAAAELRWFRFDELPTEITPATRVAIAAVRARMLRSEAPALALGDEVPAESGARPASDLWLARDLADDHAPGRVVRSRIATMLRIGEDVTVELVAVGHAKQRGPFSLNRVRRGHLTIDSVFVLTTAQLEALHSTGVLQIAANDEEIRIELLGAASALTAVVCRRCGGEVACTCSVVTCRGCGNEIDPDTCGCGTSRAAHGSAMHEGHSFVPNGCDCLRTERGQ